MSGVLAGVLAFNTSKGHEPLVNVRVKKGPVRILG